MPLPELISELEFEQFRSNWDEFRKLLAARAESQLKDAQQLRARIAFLEDQLAKTDTNKTGLPRRGRSVQVQMR